MLDKNFLSQEILLNKQIANEYNKPINIRFLKIWKWEESQLKQNHWIFRAFMKI